MNVDEDNVEPTTDLGLALPYSNQCMQTRLNDISGAGVNAASRVDVTFVASDPLSELVWSPHKGLCLKCADCSFAEKKCSILLDMEQNNVVLSPLKSITSRGINDAKPIDNMSPAAFHVESEDGKRASLIRSPKSSEAKMPVFAPNHNINLRATGNIEEMNTVKGGSMENTSKADGKGLCSPNSVKMASMVETRGNNADLDIGKATDFLLLRTHDPRIEPEQSKTLWKECNEVIEDDPSARTVDVTHGGQMWGLEVALTSEVHTGKQCSIIRSPVPNLRSSGKQHEELLVVEEENKDDMKIDCSTRVPLEKLESTAENDLHLLAGKDAGIKSEEGHQRDKCAPHEASPANSKISLCRRKGKEKALSDGEKMSKDDNGSHESVESCNSAGLFSVSKKRCDFEQKLIVRSKRAKKHFEESPASTSFVRQDSSFMNWISNMVKGLNKSYQDADPTLNVTLTDHNHGHTSHDQNIITYNRSHDPGSRNMGFRTIFNSLYCSNPKEQEPRMSNGDHPIAGEEVLDEKIFGVNVTPIACHGENDNFCSQFYQSGEKCNQTTNGNGEVPSVKLSTASANPATVQGIYERNSSENRTMHDLACGKVKDGRSSPCSSLGKTKNDAVENDSDPPADGKVVNNVGHRNNPLGSLWITRFSPKSPGPVLNLFHCHQNSGGALERSTDCTRPILHTHNSIDVPIKQRSTEAKEYLTEDSMNIVGKELQCFAPNIEASFGFKSIPGNNDQTSIYKLNPVLPSPKYESSEAMASVFARRLDALKHIKPLDVKDNATHALTTCFYCGKSGHDLSDCSEIIETERESFMRYTSSFEGAEESPCLCIRCFHNDHWAISCPMIVLSRQHQSEYGTSLGSRFGASKVQLTIVDERYPRMLEIKESQSQVDGAHTLCDGKSSHKEFDLSLKSKWNGPVSSDKRISCSNEVQKLIAPSSGDNVLKEKQFSSFFNLVGKKFSDAPKGLFDAIKKLRLTRMDILKLMNSDTSLSHLDGFFLRVRVAKWEEGLGGKGYYVACITGEQRKKLVESQKNPISVSIEGKRCLVVSQYISNQDFLEGELTAWWCATLRCGGKIPSGDHLKLKLEERKRFGF